MAHHFGVGYKSALEYDPGYGDEHPAEHEDGRDGEFVDVVVR